MDATNSTERKLSDKNLVWLDIVAGLVGAMLGHDLGKQLWKLVQGAKKSILQPGEQPSQQSTPATTVTSGADAIDLTLHSSFMGFGQADEALTGMTLGASVRKFVVRASQATGHQAVLEKRKLQQLERTIGYIAKLSQSQRDNLREAVGKIKTDEGQAQFWQDLALASTNQKNFLNFAKTMGIVREESEFAKEIDKGIANGLAGANIRYKRMLVVESRKLTRRTKTALRRP